MADREFDNNCDAEFVLRFRDYCIKNKIAFEVSGGGEVRKLLYNVTGGSYKDLQDVTFGSEKALEAAKAFRAETQEEESA